MTALVTVITASTGRDSLSDCIRSVSQQRGFEGSVQHLVFADGPEAHSKVKQIRYSMGIKLGAEVDVINLPQSVGKDRWNGHRMYAAGTFLADGEFVMFLDDDNTIDQHHISDCLLAVQNGKFGWAWTLRKIVDKNGVVLCNDDCESLGPDYATVMDPNDRLVDVNCYFIHKKLASYVSPIWHRKAREPNVMEVDRALVQTLKTATPGVGTGKYTVNYTVESTGLSVSGDFFARGNEIMKQRYPIAFPWRK
jgi:hypothetical protein